MKKLILLIIVLLISLFSRAQDTETITDLRDYKTYKTIKIGSQIWMAENLAFKDTTGCFSYKGKPENIPIYGYLYTYQTALNACPSGWHLPSKGEFMTLLNFLGGIGDKSFNKIISNKFIDKFAGYGSVYMKLGQFNYEKLNERSFFWSKSLITHNEFGRVTKRNWILDIDNINNVVVLGNLEYNNNYSINSERKINSIRCVKDETTYEQPEDKISSNCDYEKYYQAEKINNYNAYKDYLNWYLNSTSDVNIELYKKAMENFRQLVPILSDSLANNKLQVVRLRSSDRNVKYNYQCCCSVNPFYYKFLEQLGYDIGNSIYSTFIDKEEIKNKFTWLMKQEPSIVDIKYTSFCKISKPGAFWNIEITFAEKNNKIGYCLHGNGVIKDKSGILWSDNDRYGISTVISVGPGKTYIYKYKISEAKFAGGEFIISWEGEDAAGNPLIYETKFYLLGGD